MIIGGSVSRADGSAPVSSAGPLNRDKDVDSVGPGNRSPLILS